MGRHPFSIYHNLLTSLLSAPNQVPIHYHRLTGQHRSVIKFLSYRGPFTCRFQMSLKTLSLTGEEVYSALRKWTPKMQRGTSG